jgi:hypothetical protein
LRVKEEEKVRRTNEYIEVYTDYLIAQNWYATATGLSEMMNGEISHDQVTRFLNKNEFSSKDLWKKVKKTVREIESEDGCLIFDDTVQEKKWTDENDIICWHYDHTKGKSVKGLNILNMLYYSNGISIPVGFEIIKKDILYSDIKTKKQKRKSKKTKNEQLRDMFNIAIANKLKFKYVLMDIWFASNDNFEHITSKNKEFITAIKGNRLFAKSLDDKYKGKFVSINSLLLSDKESVRGYLKGYNKEIVIICRVFTNKDGSTGKLYLVCSDLTLDSNSISTLYEKRWKVEEYHKSLKSNVDLAKSPTKKVKSQSNHIFLSILSFFKLECLKIKHSLNHFALRMKLLIKANRMAYDELQRLKCV